MKLGIMQPYFFPYIGYWQLINAVDVFVVYDNIQYTKKGWFNRNRILQNVMSKTFSVALTKDHAYKNVCERFISDEYKRKKLISIIKNSYNKAPFFNESVGIIEDIINYNNSNLFNYIYNSIVNLCNYYDINTQIVISSSLDIDHNLKGEEKVLEICKNLNCTSYINAIGGQKLYDKEKFKQQGIELSFIKTNPIEYKQFNNPFIENLSIIDVMMFNNKETVQKLLEQYILV